MLQTLAFSSQTSCEARWRVPSLLNRDQLHIENQSGVRGNHAGVALGPVGKIGRDAELALAAYLHSRDAFVPSFDHVAGAKAEVKGLASDGAVELLAICEPARVVDFHVLTGACFWSGAFLDVPILKAGGSLGAFAGDSGRSGCRGGFRGSGGLAACATLREKLRARQGEQDQSGC